MEQNLSLIIIINTGLLKFDVMKVKEYANNSGTSTKSSPYHWITKLDIREVEEHIIAHKKFCPKINT